jgi:hypothetical protein
LPAAERPRACLAVVRGDERDQVEGLEQPPHDLVQRGFAFAERRGLVLRQLRQLGLELQVDPVRAVHHSEKRLQRQRLEFTRELAAAVAEGPTGVEVGEQLLELCGLGAQARVAGFRLLCNAFEAPLHVVAVGDEQLELQVLEVALRIGAWRESVDDGENRVRLAEVAELCGSGARNVDHADRGRRHL